MDEFLIEKPNAESELLWLIQQCQDGNPQAMAELISRYGEFVARLTWQLAPYLEDPEPVIVEIFTELLQTLGQYPEKSPFEQWISQIIVNATNRIWQQQPPAENVPTSLTLLEVEQRQAVLLTNYQELDQSKAANLLGASVADLQSLSAIAMEKLDEQGLTANLLSAYLKEQSANQFRWNEESELRVTNEAIRLRNDRKRKIRQRLIIFEIIWAITGLLWLVGAFQVVNTIGAEGSGTITPDAVTTTAVNASNFLPTFEPTPIRTPFPFADTQANGPSFTPSISTDGRYIVFASEASNLVDNDTNGVSDIFLFDRLAHTIRRVSLSTFGEQANGPSVGPNISADGTQLVFVSWATNLLNADKKLCRARTGEQLPCADVYVVDLESNEVSLLSQQSGEAGNGDSGISPSLGTIMEVPAISADGKRVAFYSRAVNLGADPLYGGLFMYDGSQGHLTRIDRTADGQPVNGASSWPALSGDGQLLAFQTLASNLVTDDLNGQSDIFIYAVEPDQLLRITTGPLGTGADGPSVMPDLSSDGRWLVFRSGASDLVVGDMNGVDDIFIHDLENGITGLVSVSNQGYQADFASNLPSISEDGNIVSFTSLASTLTDSGFNGTWNLYLYDRSQINLQPVVTGMNGFPVNGPSAWSKLSKEGIFLVFSSSASNLVPNDVNRFEDIFLFNRESLTIQRINIPRHH